MTRAVMLMIAVVAVLVSCGVDRGGGDDQPDSTTPPTDATEQTVLLVGVDDNKRADAIMLAHAGADGSGAAVSLPRDVMVREPDLVKLNGVYTKGGIEALVEAVRNLTGVKADHYAIVEMASFADLSDAVGGVKVCLREATSDSRTGASFPAGEQTLSGKKALDFLRQRVGLPAGELDRVVRHQAFLRGLASRLGDADLPAILKEVREQVKTDPNWDLLGFAAQVSDMRADQLRLATVPIGNHTSENGLSVNPGEVTAFVTDLFAGNAPAGTAPPENCVN